jgi:protein-L-isoaspartate(D-aspartate) O-methyltransferase
MVERQLRARGIEDQRVLEAMTTVPRERFVPPEWRRRAYDDAALPIGAEQTISQPYMVARICAELQLRGGETVLDVGTGSGYQAAVLAELAAVVHSLERIPALAEGARGTLDDLGYAGRVHVHVTDGTLGWAESAPYGGIAVAAATREPPPALLEQLELRGRLVIPIGPPHQQFLRVYIQTPEGPAEFAAVPCRFVPLVPDA